MANDSAFPYTNIASTISGLPSSVLSVSGAVDSAFPSSKIAPSVPLPVASVFQVTPGILLSSGTSGGTYGVGF